MAFKAAGITCKGWNSWNYKQGVSQCTASTCCNGKCVGHCSVPSTQVGSYPPSVMCFTCTLTNCTCLRTVTFKIGFAQITYKPPTHTQKCGVKSPQDSYKRLCPCINTNTKFSVDEICTKYGGKALNRSDFSDNKMMGFYLSRRVQYGNNWHPMDDDLRGTAVYGTPPTNPTHGPTGSIKWNYNDVQYFMFSTGDFSEWYGSVFA